MSLLPGTLPAGGRTSWPLASVLPPRAALVTLPGIARAYLARTVAGWGLGDLSEAGELVVSELVTNAVRASAGGGGEVPLVGVRLSSDAGRLLIEVWDQAPGSPVIREAGADAEAGRGLMMVAAITSGHWGWQKSSDGPGKCVHAELRGRT